MVRPLAPDTGARKMVVLDNCDTTTWYDGSTKTECDVHDYPDPPPGSGPVVTQPTDPKGGPVITGAPPGMEDDIGGGSDEVHCDVTSFGAGAGYQLLPTPGPILPPHGPFVSDAITDDLCNAVDGCSREVSAGESAALLSYAQNDGDWIYTQGGRQGGSEPPVNIAARYGDCTDFTWNATIKALGSAWPHAYAQKLSTSNFHSLSDIMLEGRGYRRIGAADARPGDIVVRAGHAGVYVGPSYDGKVWGWANNGLPATPDAGNQDYLTGRYNFANRNGYAPEFFRPLVRIPCPTE
ncbi:MAG: hypothetical protein ABJA80_14905 [bacterium]